MVLDRARLGKQRLEAAQILSAIRSGGGWSRHPAVRMWRGHEDALRLYHDVMCREWARRGYVQNMPELLPPHTEVVMPEWLGRGDVHASHRASLLAKMPEHYGAFGWTEAPLVGYVWPLSLAPAAG